MIVSLLVVLGALLAELGPRRQRTAFRKWLRAFLPRKKPRPGVMAIVLTGLTWLLPPTVVATFLASHSVELSVAVLFALLFCAAVYCGVRAQASADDVAERYEETIRTEATGHADQVAELQRSHSEALETDRKAHEDRLFTVYAECDAKLAERAEMKLRHIDAPTVYIGRRARELSGEVFLLSATFHNEGLTSSFRAVVVHRSVQGVRDANPFPDSDFALRWQTPNVEEEQRIVEGAQARVDIAYLDPVSKKVRFLGPQGVLWKILDIIGDDDLVSGLIELQDIRGARQRWEFSLSGDTGEFQMRPAELDS